jgi:1,4-dihydroxy-2-naphthoyl-CoA hydrolase
MSLLENIKSRPLPLAQLMGITFTHAEPDKVIARMVVRPDLCTLGHTIHGGSAMAFADTTGGAATLINLPADAKGTTTIESKTNFVGAAKEGSTVIATATPLHRGIVIDLEKYPMAVGIERVRANGTCVGGDL